MLLAASSFQHSYRVLCSITSFGNRANDYESVVNYFRAHFLQVHRKNNEKKRVLYSHLTNAVV
jgi:guanine nucleotide-binding protein alpha-1 subunit